MFHRIAKVLQIFQVRDTDSLGIVVRKIAPACFLIGASMELFMIKTGFYEIVTRKESERLTERLQQQESQMARLKALGVDFSKSAKSSGDEQ